MTTHNENLALFCAVFNAYGLDAAIDSIAVGRVVQPLPILEDVIVKCCAHYQVKRKDLFSGGRHRLMANIRAVTMWVMRKCSDASLPEIGQHLGGFHHSTVLHNVRRVGKDPKLLAEGALLVCQIMAPVVEVRTS
jgi:hypothetical protein